MSRIEKALEKAALLRTETKPGSVRSSYPRTLQTPNLAPLQEVAPLEVDNPMLPTIDITDIAVNEEYNKLRSQVISLARKSDFKNTLLITSSVSEEGKTLTALNLSIALAKEYDYTVLLVDADLRRPSVHSYLGLKPEAGLIQCINDDYPLDKVLIKTGIGKLVVLPAGGTVSNPIELLSSNRMREIILELKTRYPERFVIFDSPPSLNFADAQVLADIVDGTLFVAREGTVKEGQLRKSLESFSNKNLMGVVFNDVRMNFPKNYYYY